jgi:polyribonucleotide nucleotidyltransferase
VVEVDRERGRIGLRLAEDPEIAGKTTEELVALGASSGGGGGRRERSGDRGDRGPRDRDRDRNGGSRGSGRPRHRSGSGRDPERG